jgi:hypothetical protein
VRGALRRAQVTSKDECEAEQQIKELDSAAKHFSGKSSLEFQV